MTKISNKYMKKKVEGALLMILHKQVQLYLG